MQGHLWYAILLISGDVGSAAAMRPSENKKIQPSEQAVKLFILIGISFDNSGCTHIAGNAELTISSAPVTQTLMQLSRCHILDNTGGPIRCLGK